MGICANVWGTPGPVPSPQSKSRDIEALKKKVAAVGDLKFKQEVPIKYLNKNQLEKYIVTLFEAEYPAALSEKESQWIRLMGFVEEDVNLDVRSIRKRLLLANVSGLYNEKKKELLALSRYREVDFMNSLILVHELRHAVQDQYFNLANMSGARPASDFDDGKLALLAAVEGDAAFVMVQFSKLDADILTSSPTADALTSFLPIPRPSSLYREPEILKYQLLMPYINGLRFVSAVFKKKKWKGVNRILQHPPASSEQVLHPEKYLDREEPIKVFIQYQPEGYQLFHSGVVGEYFLNILVKPEGDYNYKDYALGWGGDTFHIYKNNSSYFLVWESQWDKEIYCSDFYADFKRFIEGRFDVNFKKGKVKGIDFIAGRTDGKEDYFFLMKSKKKIFYVRTDNREQMNSLIYGGNYD